MNLPVPGTSDWVTVPFEKYSRPVGKALVNLPNNAKPFNLFVVPIRKAENIATITSQQAKEIAQKYGQDGISVYKGSVIDFTSTFYMEERLGYILERKEETPYEIIDFDKYSLPEGYEVIDTFMIRRDRRILNVITKKE